MTETPKPPVKRVLPFKRTVKRKSSNETPPDDDGLSLFSRSKEYFPHFAEEQKRIAHEKAAEAEKKRKEKLAQAKREEEDALRNQFSREAESAKKRRRSTPTPSDDHRNEDEDKDEDIFESRSKSHKPRKSSTPHTPKTRPGRLVLSDSRPPTSSRASRSRAIDSPVVTLDDSEGDIKEVNPSSSRSAIKQTGNKPTSNRVTIDDDTDPESDQEMSEQNQDGEEDVAEFYVKAAMERMEKAKAERLAREAAGENANAEDESNPSLQILIGSRLEGVQTLLFTRRLKQPLELVFQTWVEHANKTSGIPRPVLENMFFTWKGNKVYKHTTLKTLEIRPDRDGKLYPGWQQSQEGYTGHDKVFFEAWTQELFDEHLRQRERARLQELGEWESEEEEEAEQEEMPEREQEARIRVTFKAKDQAPRNATLRPSITASTMIKLYRKLANIPPDKTVELHWDGEVLEAETTVGEADIGDLDSVEVHIR